MTLDLPVALQALADVPLVSTACAFTLLVVLFVTVPRMRSGLRSAGIVALAFGGAPWIVSDVEVMLVKGAFTESNSSVISLVGALLVAGASGFLVGVPITVAIESLSGVGRYTDILRGNQVAEQNVPAVEERGSPLEELCSSFAFVMFVLHGGIENVLGVSAFVIREFGNTLGGPILSQITGIAARDYLRAIVAFAAPIAVSSLFVDSVHLAMSRFAGRSTLAAEYQILKNGVALTTCGLVFALCARPGIGSPDMLLKIFGVVP